MGGVKKAYKREVGEDIGVRRQAKGVVPICWVERKSGKDLLQ
jgi:hypothetical protein